MRHYWLTFLGLLLLCPISAWAIDLHSYEHPIMRSMPALELQDQSSAIHTLKDYQGKVLLLNFWATWCQPCLEEMPSLSRLQSKLDANHIQVLPISIDRRGVEVAHAFMKRLDINNLPTLLDVRFEAMSKLKLSVLPTTLILNANHREVAKVEGDIEWDHPSVVAYLEKLVKEGSITK